MSIKPEERDSIRYHGPSAVDAPGGAIEPWFAILVSALVPLMAGLFAPGSWRTVLHVVGGVMCAWGLILLVRHEMTVRRQRNVTDR
jgi:hypothetical protein